MFRQRREERRDERQGGAPKSRYQMRQRLASIGDDFWIENAERQRVYKVDGKALRIRSTLIFEDTAGHELYKIQERMMRIRDTMEIEDAGGHSAATVKKAMITPLRERWSVDVANGPDLNVQGNLLDHEYTIDEGGDRVAEVSKKWFRVADSYGVEVEPGQNDVLILAVTAAIDQMAHAGR